MIVSGSYDKSLSISSMYSLKRIFRDTQFAGDYVSTVLFVGREKRALVGSCDSKVQIFCLQSFEVKQTLNVNSSIYSVHRVKSAFYVAGNSMVFNVVKKTNQKKGK